MPNLDPIYRLINSTIRTLSKHEAKEVLEEIAEHCESMAEGLKEEMKDDED